jgi:uncharacterized protein (DUF1684 family)
MKVSQPGLICILIFVGIVLTHACKSDNAHLADVEQWRIDRVDRLKQARGWLSLTGLYPLHAGSNSVGFADTNDIRLGSTGPEKIAIMHVDSSDIMLHVIDSMILGEDEMTVSSGPIELNSAPLMHYNAIYWTFLERSGNFYLRVWDTLSTARNALHELRYFPVDPDWRITALFTPADSGTTILLDDVLGLKRPYPVMGSLHGAVNGQEFDLIALDGGDDELFLIIEDATTDLETYPVGRYIYVDRPGADGIVEIDFNKAYNPPCAFTEFATCLLAPPENRLPFAVRAGEKTYGEH